MHLQQLTLGLALKDEATFDNFYPGENQALLQHLQTFSERFIFLWGASGTGRTHLLQACCHATTAPVLYLDLREPQLDPMILTGMECLSWICLDNIDAVMGQQTWELALFGFYNRLYEQNTRLLISAAMPPAQLPCHLADLHSRLCWGLTLAIIPLNDQQKIEALQMRAKRRGLTLSTESALFLLNRYRRDMTALFAALERLDESAMMAKHRLTIPFIKDIFNI